jgi:hypothetical protein
MRIREQTLKAAHRSCAHRLTIEIALTNARRSFTKKIAHYDEWNPFHLVVLPALL